jgi:hypothetical protein
VFVDQRAGRCSTSRRNGAAAATWIVRRQSSALYRLRALQSSAPIFSVWLTTLMLAFSKTNASAVKPFEVS